MEKEELFGNLNDGLIDERLGAFQYNLTKNLPYIKRSGGLKELIFRLKGKKVVVAGAGVSLENSFSVLKKYYRRNEIVLISTDMALRPLILAGITPHFVISCETTPVDFFGDVDTSSMHLLAFSCMSNINLRKWKGSLSFYNWMIDNETFSELWKLSGEDLGYLATGSIVTTQAVAFALGCEIDSLLLVGNDMGFTSRYYAGETISYRKNRREVTRFKTLSSIDMVQARSRREYEIQRGEKIFYTNSQFLAAKMWLEELFSKSDVKVFDASLPGCSEKYVKKVDVAEYFSSLQRKRNRKR